jgi:hypothetical protein
MNFDGVDMNSRDVVALSADLRRRSPAHARGDVGPCHGFVNAFLHRQVNSPEQQ